MCPHICNIAFCSCLINIHFPNETLEASFLQVLLDCLLGLTWNSTPREQHNMLSNHNKTTQQWFSFNQFTFILQCQNTKTLHSHVLYFVVSKQLSPPLTQLRCNTMYFAAHTFIIIWNINRAAHYCTICWRMIQLLVVLLCLMNEAPDTTVRAVQVCERLQTVCGWSQDLIYNARVGVDGFAQLP